MAKGKNTFMLYADMIGVFEKLPDDKAGQLIKHIFQYVNDQNPETDDLILSIAFEPIKAKLKRDLKKWVEICAKNKENVEMRWKKKNTTAYDRIRSDTKNTDKDKDKDKEKDIIKRKATAFSQTLIPFKEKYGSEMLRDFFNYWTEPNKSRTKIKWELEETWDVSRRLLRWSSNNFNKPVTQPKGMTF